MTWLEAFALTVAIELPIVVLLVGRGRRRRAPLDALAANLLTHPLAWWAVMSGAAPWLFTELCVVAVEACVYRAATRLGWASAAMTALAANLVTAAIGLLL